jgi:AcrR family transcriptional regulator
VPETPTRDRKREAMRARIAETALQLFVSQGFAETTFDEIASVAGVGRRTIFRYFPTKEAILFDHLVARRERTVHALLDRPVGEPALVSLHAVLRELATMGYDRRLLGQIRAVLATDPALVGEELAVGVHGFEQDMIATLESRAGREESRAEIRALTLMALSWFDAAVRIYLIEGRASLVRYFDDVVATCVRALDARPGSLTMPRGNRPSRAG